MTNDLLLSLKRSLRIRSRLLEVWFDLKRNRFGLIPLQDKFFDWRNGLHCGGVIPTRYAELGAKQVEHTSYAMLRTLFFQNNLNITPSDVLVDVGCGKGRVVGFWLASGLTNQMVGLELDPEVVAYTQERFAKNANVKILAGDAIENLPKNGTIFYLYNPFGEAVLARFIEKLISTERSKPIRVVYYNTQHGELFETDPRWSVQPMASSDVYPAILATLPASYPQS